MTRKIALIAGLFVFTFMPMQAARKLTKISFDKLTYDFGTIYEKDGNATCTFRFVNEGKTPLVILRAQASCGCTVPSYPEYPIAPGDTAEMKVEYRTRRIFQIYFCLLQYQTRSYYFANQRCGHSQ